MADSPYSQVPFPFGTPSGSSSPSASALIDEMDAQDDEARLRESEAIASRYVEKLGSRGPTKTMSPDYVAAQPTSLKTKLKVTPEEEEIILFHYASTSSLPKTASLSGVGVDKVRSVVFSPDTQDALSSLRSAMRMSVIRKIEETQTILLEAIQDESKLTNASLTQISSVLKEVSEVQLNLVNASRSPSLRVNEVDPATVFSGDELEYMAFLRRRLTSPRSEIAAFGSLDVFDASDDPGDIEAEFDVSSDSDDEISPSAPSASLVDEPSPPMGEGVENLSLLSDFAKIVMTEGS